MSPQNPTTMFPIFYARNTLLKYKHNNQARPCRVLFHRVMLKAGTDLYLVPATAIPYNSGSRLALASRRARKFSHPQSTAVRQITLRLLCFAWSSQVLRPNIRANKYLFLEMPVSTDQSFKKTAARMPLGDDFKAGETLRQAMAISCGCISSLALASQEARKLLFSSGIWRANLRPGP